MRVVLALTVMLLAFLAWPRPTSPLPPEMVFVPAGAFLSGSDDPDADPDVRPARQVTVPAFYIDRREVTHAEYRRFKPSHVIPAGAENFPITHLTRAEARAYLAAVGKRLPTSAEWEKAARGPDGRRYPWGNQWDPTRAHVGERSDLRARGVCGLPRQVAVGSFPSGASPYGCLDMCGNAWEWVADDLHGLELIRGGAFGYAERHCRTYAFGVEGTGMT